MVSVLTKMMMMIMIVAIMVFALVFGDLMRHLWLIKARQHLQTLLAEGSPSGQRLDK